MNYFKERDNLLIIDITKEKSDQKLIEFLNLNIESSSFGHYNKTI